MTELPTLSARHERPQAIPDRCALHIYPSTHLANTDSTAALDAAAAHIAALAQGLAAIDGASTIRSAIDVELTTLSQHAQTEILARVPHGDTNALAGSVRVKALTGKRPGFEITAGAFTNKGLNYGWFTELGTDAAASHAVDKIGYHHTSHGPSKNPGIAALHWFADGWKAAMHDAPQAVSKAIRVSLASILTQ